MRPCPVPADPVPAGVPARTNPALEGLAESATLAINQRSRALVEAGREVVLWGFGQSPFPVHPAMCRALAENAHQKDYLPSLGLPQLREAIAAHFRDLGDYSLDPRRIAIAPGSKEVIYQLLLTLDGPLVLPMPAWVSYRPQARLAGKPVLGLQTDLAAGYRLYPEALDSLLAKSGAAQSVMIVTSPSNPTGQCYGDAEWGPIAEVCRARNVIVIADEIYAQLCFGGRPLAPGIGVHCPERVIVTGGLSKSHGAGGWRLGFAAGCGPSLQGVFDTLATVISETYSCVSAPVQNAAVTAYSDPEVWRYVRDCARLLEAVLAVTRERLLECGVECLPSQGGFYLYPNFQPFAGRLAERGIRTSARLARTLLDEAGIALLPAEDFGGWPESLACRLAAVDFDGDAVYRAFRECGDPGVVATDAERLLPSVLEGCRRLRQWLGPPPK